jgi:diaminohydroxyphosphoribosylaminopyrimidine deaminase/5-amino-6-(5-phosphoribosylamino)uracil reductase
VTVTERDEELIARAIAVAAHARRRTAPNPWVGSVIADADGSVVGEGASDPPGGPHAEVHALRQAGDAARGGTAYVTLEPCSHYGRTPPCADALIDAGVARVVVGIEDPDPLVAGAGMDRLRDAGITVDVGLAADAVTAQLAPYLHHRRTGRSYCVAKTAVSVDGRTAAADGSSRWITGPVARADAHELRADSQAVVVGAGTALADQPQLTVRDVDPMVDHQPLRVLLDAHGRVPATGPLFDPELASTLVITTEAAPAAVVDVWVAAGAKVETVAPAFDGNGVDLAASLELLGAHGVLQALVEGGPTVHGSLLRARLVDRLVVYVGGVVMGAQGRPMFTGPSPGAITDAPRLALRATTQLGADVRLDYDPAPPTPIEASA